MGPVELVGVRLDATDVSRVAAFWAGVLQCRTEARPAGVVAVVPRDPANYPVLVHPAGTAKHGQNRVHLDLTSASAEALTATDARARELGGGPVDIGQSPSDEHVVLADPEGNELCVIEPGNGFLAGTGAIGAINCDGTRALGCFWSRALDWPLVWDQDEETVIQAPEGGTKVTWSGPPLMPRTGRDRLRLEVRATAALDDAVAQLRALGASLSAGPVAGEATLLDPDGNEFHVLAPDRDV